MNTKYYILFHILKRNNDYNFHYNKNNYNNTLISIYCNWHCTVGRWIITSLTNLFFAFTMEIFKYFDTSYSLYRIHKYKHMSLKRSLHKYIPNMDSPVSLNRNYWHHPKAKNEASHPLAIIHILCCSQNHCIHEMISSTYCVFLSCFYCTGHRSTNV